jgi:hypothetical protein
MFGSSHRVSALEAWRELSGGAKSDLSPEEQRKAEARFLFKAIAFVFALDLGSQLVLYADTLGWDASAFDPSAVWRSLTAPSAFRNSAFDTVLMAAARVIGFPLIAFAAHRAGAVRAPTAKKKEQQQQQQQQQQEQGNKKSVGGADYLALGDDVGDGGGGAAGGVLRNPLLGEQEQEQEQETSQQAAVREAESHFEQARLGCAPPRPEKNSSKKGKKDKKGAAGAAAAAAAAAAGAGGGGGADMLELERQADARKGLAMVVLFAAGSVFQVYTGVKCVSYKGFGAGSAELRRGALMGSAVLWINLEAMLTKRLLAALVGDRGHLIPEFHPHRLFHDGKLACHYCDLCGITCKEAYRCKLCDFDCCVRCFSRKDRSRGEGVLRGDKGLKKEENLSGKVYFKRALTLCWPERRIFGLAFLCLGINSAASLALPNFQGQILDKVIGGEHGAFKYDITLYILISVATGLFGGLRGLCFAVVGRRMSAAVRRKLFRGIICQDIAFFDGSTTGNLTSRLSNDANAMVAPCQTVLGTLFSNTILLFGGVGLCFWTSWRLSVLAFTTVGPVMVITETYAVWSQRLNMMIYAALGDANSVAVEALGNIRTVRGFSTEEIEIERYEVGVAEALRCGIRDAFGGAGTFAINNYLDLGAGVLILWYGGNLAMDKDSSLSVGQLITYQVRRRRAAGGALPTYKAAPLPPLTRVLDSYCKHTPRSLPWAGGTCIHAR